MHLELLLALLSVALHAIQESNRAETPPGAAKLLIVCPLLLDLGDRPRGSGAGSRAWLRSALPSPTLAAKRLRKLTTENTRVENASRIIAWSREARGRIMDEVGPISPGNGYLCDVFEAHLVKHGRHLLVVEATLVGHSLHRLGRAVCGEKDEEHGELHILQADLLKHLLGRVGKKAKLETARTPARQKCRDIQSFQFKLLLRGQR